MTHFFKFKTLTSLFYAISKRKNTAKENAYAFGSIDKYAQLNGYHTMYDAYNSRPKLNTSKPIDYTNAIAFGSSYRQVRKVMPKCAYRVSHKSEGMDRKVAVFKRKIAGQNVKIEMHFYQNKLFYFNYTFSYANASDREKLTEMLVDKYGVQTSNLLGNTLFDANKNCILVTEGTEFSINYIQTKNPFFEKINAIRFTQYYELASTSDVALDTLFANL